MRMNEAFKALADPTRRRILQLLRRGEMTAGELTERFEMTKPSMSHHFAVLKQADLVEARREGQQIYYSLNTTVAEDLLAIVWDLFSNGLSKGLKPCLAGFSIPSSLPPVRSPPRHMCTSSSTIACPSRSLSTGTSKANLTVSCPRARHG